MSNVITATFKYGNNEATTKPLTQIDYGQILKFDGIDLPASYEVHFANDKINDVALAMIGDSEGVKIPNALLQTGKYVFAWVYLHTGEDDGETVYTVTIPVTPRSTVDYDLPTEEEQSIITQAIAALQKATKATEDAQAAAETAQANAETAQQGAETAQGLAEQAQTKAEEAQGIAENAAASAEQIFPTAGKAAGGHDSSAGHAL